MTAMASMGNLVVALPPSDIWLSDEQAADFSLLVNVKIGNKSTFVMKTH